MATAKFLTSKLPGFFTVAEAHELPEDNLFTITFSGLAMVGQGAKAEEKPVLSFAESKKSLVLNKSRCKQLAALFGDGDLDGQVIRLGVEAIDGREQITVTSPE